MPTFTRSAMNPNGSWQSDAMDQSEAFNANRGDTWSRFNTTRSDMRTKDDLALQMLREQLGANRYQFDAGRQDTAAARQAEADRWGKQFDYMGNRDKLADTRWQEQFGQDKADREVDRSWRQEQRARDDARYDADAPSRAINVQLQAAALERLKREQDARNGAAGAAIYQPTNDKGKEAYTFALSTTGDPLQAGFAAKGAERSQSLADAEAEAQGVGQNVRAYSARDTAVAPWKSDPTDADTVDLVKRVEAVAQLYRTAGMSEPQVSAKVRELLMNNAGNYRDINAGKIQGLLQRFGIQL